MSLRLERSECLLVKNTDKGVKMSATLRLKLKENCKPVSNDFDLCTSLGVN